MQRVQMSLRMKGHEVLVRIYCGVEALTDRESKVIVQCMFEAARQAGLGMRPSAVVIFDVSRGIAIKGARMGARMATVIRAALATIETLWPTIHPPLRRQQA